MQRCVLTVVLFLSLLAGSSCISGGGPTAAQVAGYEDLADRSTKEFTPGQVYRMGQTGICGTVEKDHILVTHVVPGSPAHGRIMAGDRIRGMQHRGMGGWGGIRGLVGIRLLRIGRDWDWHFYVTVERPSLRNGKGNTLTYDLRIPPDPGNVCHYGPTGFFAKRYADRLVVDVVDKGSPSDGNLQTGDVILAVNGQPITIDAYKQFTEAVDKAEAGAPLRLTIKRPGEEEAPAKVMEVALSLKQLGRYSETAPVDCPKTDRLITQAAEYLVKTKSDEFLHTGLLGLLATGEEKYIEVVCKALHGAPWARPPKDPTAAPPKGASYVSWHWGYRNMLLAEYYLLTGDEFVLPAIRQHSRTLAAGQDQAGLWGHRMCHPELGRAYGYGVMNQPSLSIFISLILAEKCGVKDPVVRKAIQRTHDHYNKWVGRGALPYGNHAPKEIEFANNGTSGSLAVAFALLGNKKGAHFYGAMSAAAAEEILTGHGGPWWNILWSGLAANVLGPKMATAYNDKIHWLRTVTRTSRDWYTGIRGWGSEPKPGRETSTGSHLLNLCVGRRAIHITGKGMDPSLWLSAKEATVIVDAGVLDDSSDKALLAALGSPFPPVRVRAAQALAMRDAKVDDAVMALLVSGTPAQQVGAIHAITSLKIEGVEDELVATVKNEKADLWVRMLAARALGGMEKAKGYAPELLKLLVQEKPYDQPYREFDLALGSALLTLYEPDPYATDLDKDLFYRGVATLLDHKHASGRLTGINLIRNLPREDLPKIVDKMVYVIEDKDKTYTFYNGSGRQEAIEILYRLGIKESMDYTVNTIKEPTGRGGPRVRKRMRLMKTFGAEAKYLIPRIKEVLGKGGDPIVKQIEESPTARTMTSIQELKNGRPSRRPATNEPASNPEGET